MNIEGIRNDRELPQILWACHSCWQTSPTPIDKRELCYRWVLPTYVAQFGTPFLPARLRRLARLGFLRAGASSRGGNRRYYALVNPAQVGLLLARLGLPPANPAASD